MGCEQRMRGQTTEEQPARSKFYRPDKIEQARVRALKRVEAPIHKNRDNMRSSGQKEKDQIDNGPDEQYKRLMRIIGILP